MTKLVQDVGALCREGLEPLGAERTNEAHRRGDLLMGVTEDTSDVVAECGWDGRAAMLVVDARARERLAVAFAEASDDVAAAWLRAAPSCGTARVVVSTGGTTLFVAMAEDETRVEHESGVDWEPRFFAATAGSN